MGIAFMPLILLGEVKMVGRTPLLIFDINQKNPAFRDSPALFRPGDRIKLIPLSGAYMEMECLTLSGFTMAKYPNLMPT